MKIIRLEDVVIFHKRIILQTGGSPGIRDMVLIDSSLQSAFGTFDGKDLYPGDIQKMAAIAYRLIRNHGFIDGNKRIGVAVMLLLVRLNDVDLRYDQNELVTLGQGVAEGSIDQEGIQDWIDRHMKHK